MPKRIYVGGHDAVDVLVGDQIVTVKKGGSIELPDDVAKECDKSAAWSTTPITPKAEKE